jgi:transcriptional regulator with XRE-family HTH domain
MPRKRSGRALKTIRPELKFLAQQLRNARTKAGLTQDEVAEQLEITAQTVRNWEVGRTESSASRKEALSCIYGIQTAALVGLDNRKGLTTVAPHTRVVADPERLKFARRRSGLQQRQATTQSAMSPETLGCYEPGVATPSKANLESLATT